MSGHTRIQCASQGFSGHYQLCECKHFFLTLSFTETTGATDAGAAYARGSGAKAAAVDGGRTAADPLQDIPVGHLCAAQRARVSRPLHQSRPNVPTE